MQSTNSFFNKTLYRKQMIRFWPLWGAYGLIMTMVMPLYYLVNLGRDMDFAKEFAVDFVLGMGTFAAPWISAFAGILGAMAVWSYLYNSRSVGMLHALPMKREGLFLTNYLAGLSFLALPTLAVFVLTLGAEAIGGVIDVRSLAIWLLCQCLTYLFFFSFATLLAFVTGALMALPALYIIFNGLAAGLALLLNNTFSNFVYGFSSAQPISNVGYWLTPLNVFARELNFTDRIYDEALGKSVLMNPPKVMGLPVVLGAAGIGLVLAVLALVLYRRRKLEMAGEVVAVSWLRPVFKYGVALCGSLTFGNAFYAMFAYTLPEGILTMLFFLLLWGAVFYFAAEMLLKKSFRIFGKSWRGCVTLLCVIIACVLVMELDVTGYEKSIPSIDEVKLVSSDGSLLVGSNDLSDTIVSDPTYIAQAIDLHTALVNSKREVETRLTQGYLGEENENGLYISQQEIQTLYLEYMMKDGSRLTRVYQIPVTKLLLQDPASSAAKLNALANNAQWREKDCFPSVLTREAVVSGSMNRYEMVTEAGTDDQYLNGAGRTFTKEEAQLLYDAMKEDVAAGRLGKKWLLQDEEYYEIEYHNDINLTFYGPFDRDRDGKPINTTWDVSLPLQTTATSTLAVLGQLGLVDGVDLWTEGEFQKMQNEVYSYDESREMAFADDAAYAKEMG